MIVCHVCGTENPVGSKFCEGCGVELPSVPFQSGMAVIAAPIAQAIESVPALEIPPLEAPALETPPLEVPALEVPALEVPALEVPALEVAAPALEAIHHAPEAVADAADSVSSAISHAADAAIPGLGALPEVETLLPLPTADESALEITPPEVAPAVVVAAPTVAALGSTLDSTINPKATMETPISNAPKVARLIPRNLGLNNNEPYIMHSERMVVGRFDPSAGPVDIDLSGGQGENYISRRHAEVYLENGTWLVRDLGSTNGVYVKRAGQAQYSPRIIEPQALSDGDEVAFGNMKFLFSSDVA